MPVPLKVLIVEDSQDDADLVLRELQRAGYSAEWKRVENETDFLVEIGNQPDVILSDFSMPEFDGLRAVRLLRDRGLETPFILISGTVGEDIAVEAIKQGVTDYLLKDRIARLGSAVQRALKGVEELNERRRLRAQFIEAQKMEVIGQLAAGVAHDFNNILAIIMGYSELILSTMSPDNQLCKYIEEIRHASERAVGLTRQLLLFSRKEVVRPVVVDLTASVLDMDKMIRRLIGENIEVSIQPGEAAGCVRADPGHIVQLLMNLVVNARDAMPNGGTLTVTTGGVTWGAGGSGLPAGTEPGDYVFVAVRDTGTGMTEEIKARLFEPFFTTKAAGKGTGLGLAICQAIVQQSGGLITVDSAPDRGSEFRAYFPKVGGPVEAKPAGIPGGGQVRGTETLLVVEDDGSVRDLACTALEAKGFRVFSAPNGQEALRWARENPRLPVRLVIADVIMPLMGGKAMSEELKAVYPGLKIIFTSGHADEAIVHYGVLDEGIVFLPKPYTPATLTGKVRELLDSVH